MLSFIDQTVSNHPFQVILVYSSSNCPLKDLLYDIKPLVHQDINTIITGDFNFDKKDSNVITHFLHKNKFTQLVDWPTHKEGRTIDHCYVSENVRVQVTKHSPYYTDHDALCIEFEHFPWC